MLLGRGTRWTRRALRRNQDVEELGARSGTEGVQAFPESVLELIEPHRGSVRRNALRICVASLDANDRLRPSLPTEAGSPVARDHVIGQGHRADPLEAGGAPLRWPDHSKPGVPEPQTES